MGKHSYYADQVLVRGAGNTVFTKSFLVPGSNVNKYTSVLLGCYAASSVCVCVCVCVCVLTIVWVFWQHVYLYLLCFCIFSFMCIYSYLLLV